MRDELLNREVFYTLEETQILIEHWRQEYYTLRPYSSPGLSPADAWDQDSYL